ncbi:hypothetical protein FHR85_001757 [Alkalibacillus almallahensis]|nr:hypothetical protein [Alkalibacillus almallahensis]
MLCQIIVYDMLSETHMLNAKSYHYNVMFLVKEGFLC